MQARVTKVVGHVDIFKNSRLYRLCTYLPLHTASLPDSCHQLVPKAAPHTINKARCIAGAMIHWYFSWVVAALRINLLLASVTHPPRGQYPAIITPPHHGPWAPSSLAMCCVCSGQAH